MTNEEKVRLLYYLLVDIRGYFPRSIHDKRLLKVEDLAIELELKWLIKSINEYIKSFEEEGGDGRWFRDDYDKLFRNNKFLKDRIIFKQMSDEFRNLFSSLVLYPEYVLGND